MEKLESVPNGNSAGSPAAAHEPIFLFCIHGQINSDRLKWLRKNSRQVMPKGWVFPRNLIFLGFGEEKQIPRSPRRPRDDKKALFPQPVKPVLPGLVIFSRRSQQIAPACGA